jgi:GntR family transcriptional regulator of arabinose operon
MKSTDLQSTTETDSRRPKYQRIRDHLYSEIRAGRLAPGQSLPTEARLVESLGFSRHTVRQALAELENDGVIERVQGRGTFVTTEQQRLARQQMNVFAFVAPELQSGMYPSFLHGFQQACASCQHQTMVGNSGNDVGRQADLLMQMMVQAVGGIAIVPTTMPETPSHQIKLLQQSQIPVVMCHRSVQGVAAPSVVYCGREIGLLAGEHLRDQGHRRIAIVFMRRYSMVSEYERGLRDAFENAGLSSDGVIAVEYGTDAAAPDPRAVEALQNSIAKLLSQPNRPTAIYCGNGNDAEIVYLQATKMGLSIPGDISLVCFNSTLRGHGLANRITTVAIDECELGRRAAELLHDMRTGKRALDNEERFEFRASLLPGETVGPAARD